MIIDLNVLGSIKKYIPEDLKQIEIDEGTTIKQLKVKAGIPQNLAVGYVVNGMAVNQDYVIEQNDDVTLVMLMNAG